MSVQKIILLTTLITVALFATGVVFLNRENIENYFNVNSNSISDSSWDSVFNNVQNNPFYATQNTDITYQTIEDRLSAVPYVVLDNASGTETQSTGNTTGTATVPSQNRPTNTASAQDPRSCVLNGFVVPNGQSIQTFEKSIVMPGEPCLVQRRICLGGTLTGSYQYAECQTKDPTSCLFDDIQLDNGVDIIAYKVKYPEPGNRCESEIRTCTNGVLSGSYVSKNCGSR